MSRPMKILATVIALVLVGALVTGVAYWTVEDESPDAPGLYIDGKQVETPDVMLSVGTRQFTFAEYRHYFLQLKSLQESYYGTIDWENDPDGDLAWGLRKSVELELATLAAWLEIAGEEGVTLSQEDQDDIAAVLADQKELHGADFGIYLEDMFLPDEETYVRVTEWQQLSDKIQAATAEKLEAALPASFAQEADQEFRDNYITAKHILIKADDTAEDAEQAKADALASAEAICEEILKQARRAQTADTPAAGDEDDADEDGEDDADEDGEDAGADDGGDEDDETPAGDTAVLENEALAEAFDVAMNEYSEDTGLASYPDGYTFAEGEMVAIFYETAMALAEYEMSEPVWSESSNYSGWHIILRLPLSEDELAANRENAVSTEVNRQRQEIVDSKRKSMEIIGGPYYEELMPDSIR